MLKSAALKMSANLENLAGTTGLEKISFHSSPKECSNYRTIVLISHTSKAVLKILQARLQQYVNRKFPDIQAGFRKVRECWKQGFLGTLLSGPLLPGCPRLPMAPFPVGLTRNCPPSPQNKKKRKEKKSQRNQR